MKQILIAIAFVILSPLAVFSQTDAPVCISQAAANVCGQNARLIPTLEEKIAVLESALLEKDKSIAEITETSRQNVADLTKQNTTLLVDNALKTGQIIQLEADRVRWTAVIDVLIKNSRKKSIGIIAF